MDAGEGQGPNVLLRAAAVLYGLGMLILVSPVMSDVPYDGQFSRDGDFTSVCGLTLTAAFVSPVAVEGDEPERKADCAARASDRVGYGLLALAVAAPSVAGVSRRQVLHSR